MYVYFIIWLVYGNKYRHKYCYIRLKMRVHYHTHEAEYKKESKTAPAGGLYIWFILCTIDQRHREVNMRNAGPVINLNIGFVIVCLCSSFTSTYLWMHISNGLTVFKLVRRIWFRALHYTYLLHTCSDCDLRIRHGRLMSVAAASAAVQTHLCATLMARQILISTHTLMQLLGQPN